VKQFNITKYTQFKLFNTHARVRNAPKTTQKHFHTNNCTDIKLIAVNISSSDIGIALAATVSNSENIIIMFILITRYTKVKPTIGDVLAGIQMVVSVTLFDNRR